MSRSRTEQQNDRIKLSIVRDGQTVAERSFSGPKISIGRAPGVDLKINDPFISGRHCNIEIQNHQVFLHDRGSTNGTILNGHKASREAVKDGDAVKIGKTFVVVHFLNGLRPAAEANVARTRTDRPAHMDKTIAEMVASELDVKDPSIPNPSVDVGMGHDFPSDVKLQTRRLVSADTEEVPEPTKVFDPNYYDEVAIEDFDRNFVSSFKLVKALTAPEPSTSASRPRKRVMEVLRTRRDDVLGSAVIKKGVVVIGARPTQRKIARVSRRGTTLFIHPEDQGTLILGGRKVAIQEAIRSGLVRSRRGSRYSLTLGYDDQALIKHENQRIILRYMEEPRLPGKRFNVSLSREMGKALAISFLTHVLAIGIVALISSRVSTEKKKDDLDRFAKIELKKPEIKPPPAPKPPPEKVVKAEPKPKPKPKPKVKPKPKPKPKKQVVQKAPKPKTKPLKRATKVAVKKPSKRPGSPAKRPAKKAGSPRNVAKAGVLGALGGLSKKLNNNQVASAITNLKAVKARGGAQTFSVSGLQGKVDSDDVSIQRIGDLNTKGGALGNRNYGVAAVAGQKGSGFGVAALVEGDDPVVNPRGAGGLTAAQVMEIISKNMWQLNNCYEKALLDSPGLQGKMIVDWAISPSGKVTSVRIKKSELRNARVNACVTQNIRSWTFPRAKSKLATDVNFPFVFSQSSF